MGVMQNGHTQTQEVKLPILKRCDGEGLRAHWPWLRSKLEIVKKKALVAQKRNGLTRSYATWIPEQIRMAIIKGLASQNTVELHWVMDEDGAIDGFVLSSYPFDEFLQAPLTFFIWVGYSEKAGLLERVEPLIDGLALDRGCIQIEHISGRMGWIRRQRNLGLDRGGWKLSQLHYRKELL
jgi:hypothetical protein